MTTEKDIYNLFLKEIGAKVKKERLAKDLSLEKLGLEIGLTRMQVHRIEAGYNITLKTLLKLSMALDLHPENLVKSRLKYKKEDLEKLVNTNKSTKLKKKEKK